MSRRTVSNPTGDTSGVGTAYHSGVPDVTHVLSEFLVVRLKSDPSIIPLY